jgi:hypothetical protein
MSVVVLARGALWMLAVNRPSVLVAVVVMMGFPLLWLVAVTFVVALSVQRNVLRQAPSFVLALSTGGYRGCCHNNKTHNKV